MLSDKYSERISNDWIWREKDLRTMDSILVKNKTSVAIKSGILIVYSHWEGHFKFCASQLLEFIAEGVRRKVFTWTDIRQEIRQRILFCSYRRLSLSGQNHETFISYLNALHDDRYTNALSARDEIIMVDDNLNTMRAEAICRNLGVEYAWFVLKKIVVDERLLEHRNTIAHGSQRLRSGDEIDYSDGSLLQTIDDVRVLIRETKNNFENAIATRSFLMRPYNNTGQSGLPPIPQTGSQDTDLTG